MTILILLTLSLFIGIKSCKEDYQNNKDKDKFRPMDKVRVVQKDSIPIIVLKPNIVSVQDDLLYYDVKYPDIVLQQTLWETGWFKSEVCREHNNLFGFKTNKGYLKFNTWQESIQYYKKWQDRRYDTGDYYQFLMNLSYSGDSLYDTHLKSIHVNKRKLQGIPSY